MNNRFDKKLTKLDAKIEELLRIKEQVLTEKNKRLSEESQEILDLAVKIDSLSVEYGVGSVSVARMLLSVVKGTSTTTTKTVREVSIKYRDTAPECESNTWTGRGKMPLWLQRYVANGKSKEDFLV